MSMELPQKNDTKFESVDLPKILAALHRARLSKAAGRVTVEFAASGGVIAIKRSMEENLK